MANEEMKMRQLCLETSDTTHSVTQHLILKKLWPELDSCESLKFIFWQDIMMFVWEMYASLNKINPLKHNDNFEVCWTVYRCDNWRIKTN